MNRNMIFKQRHLINSRLSSQPAIIALLFLQFTHFHDFWSQIGVVILVTPKQEVERKSEWFCGVIFFALDLKQSEKTVFERKFAFSLVFCSHAAISIWFLLFFQFFGSDCYLNGFLNPFIVHFGPSFLNLTLGLMKQTLRTQIACSNKDKTELAHKWPTIPKLVFCQVNNTW